MFACNVVDGEKQRILRRQKAGVYRRDINLGKDVFLGFVGLTNVALGILLTITYLSLNEAVVGYAGLGAVTRSFSVARAGEYKMYVQLSGFYQDHLKYTKSVSVDQLKGKATDKVSECSPLAKQGRRIIYPCGLIANSLFQDRFRIAGRAPDTGNIVWRSERSLIKPTEYTFEQIVAPPAWAPYRAVPDLSQNPWLVNWFAIAPFPTFRKLYGRVVLQRGRNDLEITSSFPYGTKAVVFAETCWAGTRNLFLSVLMLVAGAAICGFVLLRRHAAAPRAPRAPFPHAP